MNRRNRNRLSAACDGTGRRDETCPCRAPSRVHRILDTTADLLTGSGWPAQLAYHIGFQRKVRVLEHDYDIPSAEPFPPFKIAFASDFHAGPLTHPRLWTQACDRLEEMQADLLLLGGDFVSVRARFVEGLAVRLGKIPAPLGRYTVLGNHDLWTDERHITATLAANGVKVLLNENVHLPLPWEQICICGLDDYTTGAPDAAKAFQGAAGTRIVLMHCPTGLLSLEGHEYCLALCGHTHGGQISLPGGTPVVVPSGALARRYSRGEHEICSKTGKKLVVSRGVGCSGLPFRAFSPAEVHLFRIAAKPN